MKKTCRDFQKQVQPFINHQLDDQELKDFLEHIKTCKKCADELETYYIVDYSLKYLDNDTTHSYNIQQMLQERLKEEEHDLKLRRVMRILIPIGLFFLMAATVIMIILDVSPDLLKPVIDPVTNFFEELWRIR